MNKRSIISVFVLPLFLLPTLFAEGQIDIGKAKEFADSNISKDEAVYEFVSNRPDLMIESLSIDSVYPEIYPEGNLTRYKVRLKLTNGVDKFTTRTFSLRVKESTVTGTHPNKRLKGGTRYEVEAMVPEVVIDQRDRTRTTDFYPAEKNAQVVLRSKYQLDISLIGSNRRFNAERTADGYNQYKVVVAVDSLNVDGMVEPQLLITVKGQKSNNIYINLSELKYKDKKTYDIYPVELPATGEQRGNVIFNITPSDVETLITFNGKKDIAAKETYDDYVRYGAYPYEIKASNEYHTESGIVVVNSSRVEVPINLRTQYGTLIVQGPKVIGATIYLDGVKMGTAPLTMERVISGRHTLKVTKERCGTYEEEIVIDDGQTVRREPEMVLRYAHLVFSVGEDAEIWINDRPRGKGKVEDDFEGELIVECKKEHHKSTRQKIQANPGEYRSIPLEQPIPKYGKLNVSSSPSAAQVYIDGELQKSSTPVLITGLLEGKHEVLVRKKGKADEYREVEIKENQGEQISVQMKDAYSVKVHTNATEYSVKVNGRDLGQVKTIDLPVGNHIVVLSARGYEDYSKTVNIPGVKELRAQMTAKSYWVTVKSDDPDARFQRDGHPNLYYVNKPFKLEHGQHTLSVVSNGITKTLKVFIISDTTVDLGDTVAGPKTPPVNDTTSTGGTSVGGGEDLPGRDNDTVKPEPKWFKYQNFSRWTLDVNMATTTMYSKMKSNTVKKYDDMYGGTFAYTGKRGWGFYLSGYFAVNNTFPNQFGSYYYRDAFDVKKSENIKPDKAGAIGIVRRVGSPRSSIDIQFYMGLALLNYETYTYRDRSVYNPITLSNETLYYVAQDRDIVDIGVDFGMRFGLEHRTKFGWINFTMGGMYIPSAERVYLTGGISLGNAFVAGAMAGLMYGVPKMMVSW